MRIALWNEADRDVPMYLKRYFEDAYPEDRSELAEFLEREAIDAVGKTADEIYGIIMQNKDKPVKAESKFFGVKYYYYSRGMRRDTSWPSIRIQDVETTHPWTILKMYGSETVVQFEHSPRTNYLSPMW